MKIGIFTALFHDRPIEAALDTIAQAGIQAVELGAGAYPGSRHLDDAGGVQKLIDDNGARKHFIKLVEDRGLKIDSLSVHGNALHPERDIALDHHDAFVNAVLLAEKLARRRCHGKRCRQIDSQAVPATTLARKIQTGSRAHGQTSSAKF